LIIARADVGLDRGGAEHHGVGDLVVGQAVGVRAHGAAARTASWQAAYQHALAAGFDRAFLVASWIALLILLVAIAGIRVRRADLNGS
jgi:hypothetical protein